MQFVEPSVFKWVDFELKLADIGASQQSVGIPFEFSIETPSRVFELGRGAAVYLATPDNCDFARGLGDKSPRRLAVWPGSTKVPPRD